jgi:hypothetical protein
MHHLDDKINKLRESEGIFLAEDDTPFSKEPFSETNIKSDLKQFLKNRHRMSMAPPT